MSAVKTKKLSITERIVDAKRHTIGYTINQSYVPRDTAVQLARLGWLEGARIAYQGRRPHLTGLNARLYDLPIRIAPEVK